MKKIVLVALVAATSAFGMTDGKSLVELNDCFDGNRCSNLDFKWATDDEEVGTNDADLEEMDIALNYNYLFTNNFGAGLTYASRSETRDGDIIGSSASADNSQTIGVNLFWNFDGGWESSYVAVRYATQTWEETDKASVGGADTTDTGVDATEITLEYGKRMQMGKVFGLALHYSPSVAYSMTTTEYDASNNDDLEETELRLNVANFAVSF